jgi:hypothetical protein
MRQSTIFILLLIPFFAKAQEFAASPTSQKTTTVGNIIRDRQLVAEFYYYFEHQSIEVESETLKYDTTYAIRFKNYKYPDQNNFMTVEFNQTRGKADSIYDALKIMFKDENKDNASYSVTFILNYGDTLQIRPYKNDNLYFCELDAKDAYIRLTEIEVDKLFHKIK